MAIVIALLWVFYLLASAPVYRAVKRDYALRTANAIAENIDNENYSLLVRKLAYADNSCILISDSSGNEIYSQHVYADCMIHNVSAESLADYYGKTLENGGKFTADGNDSDGTLSDYDPDDFEGDIPIASAGSVTSITCVIAKTAGGESLLITVESVVTPPASTRLTWIITLSTLTFALLVAAVTIAFVLGKGIADPIIKLTEAASDIAKGGAEAVDISAHGYKEINELKQGLEIAAREVADLERYRRELIANVSHDLRTPLTLIKGYAELMRDIPSEAGKSENFDVIIDEATRLTGLVNDMLDLSREQEKGDRMRLDTFDIVKTLSALVERHGKLIEHLGYRLEFEHEERALVYADEKRITQVVYNLINNAVNYSGEDKVVVIRQFTKGSNVRIEVTDHGEGVDVNILPHIWDRYFKSDKSHKRATVGTGLGLSIVKTVMEKHPGGVYGVISEKGKGSTFYIELPKYR